MMTTRTVHLRMMTRRPVLLACILILALVSSSLLVPARSAHAATYVPVRGAIINGHNSSRVAGATVSMYRWTGSAWLRTATTTTDANGNYVFPNARTGYYWYVGASKNYGTCASGIAVYAGNTPSIYLTTSTTANVYVYFQGWAYC